MGEVTLSRLTSAIAIVVFLLSCVVEAGGPVFGSCFHRVEVGSVTNVTCPEACPYAAQCRRRPLERAVEGATQCVRAQDCWLLSKGGAPSNQLYNGSGVCYRCDMPGCIACASNSQCAQCMDNYDFNQSGQCVWKHRVPFFIFLACLFLLAMWILMDFVISCCFPNENPAALKHGLRIRELAKVRDLTKRERNKYPLTYNVHTKQICGPGLTLFFNWFILVFLVSSWLAIISAIFVFLGLHSDRELTTICNHVVLKDPTDLSADLVIGDDVVKSDSKVLIVWTGLAYFGSAIMSFVFIVIQRSLWEKLKHDKKSPPMLHRYAVEARGFPRDATDRDELIAWWKDQVNDVCRECGEEEIGEESVVDVSIAYDYTEHTDEVTRLIDDHLRDRDAEYSVRDALHRQDEEAAAVALQEAILDGVQPDSLGLSPYILERLHSLGSDLSPLNLKAATADSDDLEFSELSCSTSSSKSQDTDIRDLITFASHESDEQSNDRVTGSKCPARRTFWMQVLSSAMLGTEFLCPGKRISSWDTVPSEVSDVSRENLFDSFQCSGRVFVILQHQRLVRLIDQYEILPRTWHGQKIQVSHQSSEPTNIQWQNFGIEWRTHAMRLVVSAIVTPTVIALWAFLYWPWASFSLYAGVNASGIVTFGTDQMLSAVIAIGNCLVSYTGSMLVTWYGFRHDHNMRITYLLVIVPAVALNVVVDVVVTWKVVWAESRNFENFENDPNFFWSYGMDAIFGEVFRLLIPTYILVPYVLEPLCTIFLPYWLGVFTVKSDRTITKHHAERILLAADIDIINPPYADMICTTSVFLWTLWSPHSKHWQLFLGLAFFIVLLYWQNKFRILRCNTRTSFSTPYLSTVESYLWSIPLGILAANFAAQFGDLNIRWQRLCFGVSALVLHVLIHCLVVWLVLRTPLIRSTEHDEETYEKAIKRSPFAADYRNTNPIEVLLSRRHGSATLPLTYCRPGKEYLQEQPKIQGEISEVRSLQDQTALRNFELEDGGYWWLLGYPDIGSSDGSDGECDPEGE